MFGRSLPPRRTLELDPSMAGLKSDLSFCTVRAAPGDTLDTVTIYLSLYLYLSTVLGPVLTLLPCLLSPPFSSSCLPASFMKVHLQYFRHISVSDVTCGKSFELEQR